MLKKRLSFLKAELETFSVKEKRFTLFAMAAIFLIALEYAITRPSSTSLFLHYYGARSFPYVWLISVPVNLAFVSMYNYFLPRIGCVKTWGCISLFTIFINSSAFMFVDTFNFLSFLQFLWKDIYILLMYKQIWSLIHTSVSFNRAKYLYGFIFAMGGIAATMGGILPGFLATKLGSKQLFIFTLPIYLILFYVYIKAYTNSNFSFSLKKGEKLFPGFKNSRYIIFTLLLVVFMQVSVAIVEYRYNLSLEKAIIDIDLRTEFTGKILTVIHILMMTMQLIGAVVLINFFGLKNIHFFIPITLLINTFLFIFVPSLAIASYLFIYIKSVDFSIFGIVREMLYLPMSVEEKFKAKSLIDVFAYRSAKGLAAFFVIFFEVFSQKGILSFCSVCIFILWAFVVRELFKRHYIFDASST